VARLIQHNFAERHMHGWELDPAVIMMAELHLGMQQLKDIGCLVR
jgi:hypothetical protein